MNKARGCLSGRQECFPLATSIPCPPRHPLSDINFPTPVYSRVADGQTKAQRGEASPCCRRVNRSSGCQAGAANQTWGSHGLHPQLQLLCSKVTPGQDPVIPVPKQTTLWELQPAPTWSPGAPHPHPCSPPDPLPQGAVQLLFCWVLVHAGGAAGQRACAPDISSSS